MEGDISYNTTTHVVTVTIERVYIHTAFSGSLTGYPFDCYAVLADQTLTNGRGVEPYEYYDTGHSTPAAATPSPVISSVQTILENYVNPLTQPVGTNLATNIIFSVSNVEPPTNTIILNLNIFRIKTISGSEEEVWSRWWSAASLGWSLYTISYNANGGSGAPSSQTKIQDTDITLSSTVPMRSGYTFQGWATSLSATTAEYQPGQTYTGNADLTLYAVWTLITYPVSYNANGGTGAPNPQTKNHGEDLTLSSVIPTRTNYGFKGWSTDSDSTSAQYQPGAIYTVNAPLDLYAVWGFSIRDRKTTIEGNEVWALATGFIDGTNDWNVNPSPSSSSPLSLLSSDSYYLTWELLMEALYLGRQINMPSLSTVTYDIGSVSNDVWVAYTDGLDVRHTFNATLTVSLRSRPNWLVPQRFRSYSLVFTITGDASADMPPEGTGLWITYNGTDSHAVFQFSDVGWCDNTLTLNSLPAIDDIPETLQDVCSYWGNSEHGGYITSPSSSMMIGSASVRMSLDLRESGIVKIKCLVPDSFTADLESYNPLGGFGPMTNVSLNRETGIFSSTSTQAYLVDVNFPH